MSAEEAWPLDRASAVELLRIQIARHEIQARGQPIDPDKEIKLPLSAARIVLECAEAGMHKGQGRRGVRLSHGAEVRREGIVRWAKGRKAKLRRTSPRPSALDAELQAVEEASDLARDHGLNLSAETIKRGMHRRVR